MKKKYFLAFALSFLGFTKAMAAEKTAFTDVLFTSAPSIQVQVEGQMFYLLGINGISRADLMTQCQSTFGPQCQCQFAEKFTETMAALGQPVGETARVRLYQMADHSITESELPVNEDNQMELLINRERRNEICFP